jgi:hypothetical protein
MTEPELVLPPIPKNANGPFPAQNLIQQSFGEIFSHNGIQQSNIAFLGDENLIDIVPSIVGSITQAASIHDFSEAGMCLVPNETVSSICSYIDNFNGIYDVIIILIGLNDFLLSHHSPDLSSCWDYSEDRTTRTMNIEPSSGYAGSTNYVLKTLRSKNPNATIIWCAIPKSSDETTASETGLYISDVNKIIKECCEEHSVYFVDSYSRTHITSDGTGLALYYDGAYLNSLGKTKLAQRIAKELFNTI